jgi:hypothetical protein
MKREKHEVAPLLVVGRRGFQNDHDHRSYVLLVGSLRMQVHDEGGVRVGAGVDGAIIVVLGKRDPLGSGELLFQVMSDGLLLPSEGGGTLTRPCLIQGLVCGSHDNDESLLLSVHSSGGGLSRGCGIVLLPLGGGDGGMLPIDGGEVGVAARHSRQDGGGGRRRALGLGQRCAKAKKQSMVLITMLERCVSSKVRCLYCLMKLHIYMGQPTRTLVRVGCVDVGGQTAREGGPLMGCVRSHVGDGPEPCIYNTTHIHWIFIQR